MPQPLDNFGLTIAYYPPHVMSSAHRHNEVELNLLASGSMVYRFGGGQITVEAGQLVVFWGAVPHQLVDVAAGTHFHCVTLPLAWFLRWELPTPFVQQVLHGQLITSPAEPLLDEAIFHRWITDFRQPSPERTQIILLELEARLRRLTLAAPSQPNLTPLTNSKAAAMAGYIAAHAAEALTVDDIAAVVGLNASYAMTLFRRTYHLSLLDYLMQHRIAHAQRLLATTDMRIIDIALESGFGSQSRFYEAFGQVCGQSPGAYRAALTRHSS